MSLTEASAAPPAREAPALPSLRAVCLTVALLFLAGALPKGVQTPSGRALFDGVGPRLDSRFPGGGRLEFHRVQRQGNRERAVIAEGWFGLEAASLALLILGLPLGLRALGGSLRLRPSRVDGDVLLSVLSVLVPTVCLGGFAVGTLAGLFAPAHLEREVYSFALPGLAVGWAAPWIVLRFCVLAPLTEEVLWRGIVFRGLCARLPWTHAALLSAFAFGLWHVLSGWDQLLAIALQYGFGLLSCWLVHRTQGLAASIALHALGNAAGLALYGACMAYPEGLLQAFQVR